MTATTTGLRGISFVCVPTTEQDRAVEFYQSLGFEKRVDEPFGGGYRWIEVYPPEGGTGVALAPPPPPVDATTPTQTGITPMQTGITLTTVDIDATHAGMKALGVDVDADVSRMGDPVPPLFWFRDPSGHTLMVVEQP
jgi:catechol 2,3-dioxygenase-like lactoylglutathione lyase family enzyme